MGSIVSVDFMSSLHRSTSRDYVARVTEYPKEKAAEKAKQWGYDYWDGDRRLGFGGYRYDGRWRAVAESMAKHYGLKAGDSVLDVGCGKAFLLHDLAEAVPGLKVTGIDVSKYAIDHAPEAVQPFLTEGTAAKLPFDDKSFDLIISINTLHNLYCYELDTALREIVRVGRDNAYICVESYRNEAEKVNLLYWQLTCETFCTPEEWAWWFDRCGYTGDHSFIYFE